MGGRPGRVLARTSAVSIGLDGVRGSGRGTVLDRIQDREKEVHKELEKVLSRKSVKAQKLNRGPSLLKIPGLP